MPILQTFEFCPQTDTGFAINGTDVVTIGLLKLKFAIGDRLFVTKCRVMRSLVRPIVLGWDFLCANKTIINLDDSTLSIKGTVVPFLKRNRFLIPSNDCLN